MRKLGLLCQRAIALTLIVGGLLAMVLLDSSSTAQPSGSYCDASYCYTQVCKPTDKCGYVTNRVCRPVTKQDCSTQNVKRCQQVPSKSCGNRAVYGCRTVYRKTCSSGSSRYRLTSTSYAAQQLGSYSNVKLVRQSMLRKGMSRSIRRPSYRYHRPQVRPHHVYRPNPKPYYPYKQQPTQYHRPHQQQPGSARQPQNCGPTVQKICGPQSKYECHYVPREVCSYAPQQACQNRDVQECHDERKYVCEKGQDKCYTETRPRYAGLEKPAPPIYTDPPPAPKIYPPSDPPAPAPAPKVYPDPPQPPPIVLPMEPPPPYPGDPPSATVYPPPPARPSPAPPISPSVVQPAPQNSGPAVVLEIQGRRLRIDLKPVAILSGGGIAALLGLLLLWPRRKSTLDSDELHRYGVMCRAEPDKGGQTVTHLETPPLGPRITVRTIPGSRRQAIVMS